MNRISLDWRWLLAVALSLLGMALLVWLAGANRTAFLFFNAWGQWSPALWSGITLMGDTLVLFSLLLLFVGRRPDAVFAVIIASLAVALAVHSIKPFLDLPRPPALLGPEQLHTIGYVATSGSFPSGHTAAAFTLAGVLCMLSFPRWFKSLALAMAVLVALSRMAVGIHWPSDVIGGALIGWLSALIGVVLASKMHWGQSLSVQRFFAVLLLLVTIMLPFSGDLGYPLARPLLMLTPLIVLFFALRGLRRVFSGGNE